MNHIDSDKQLLSQPYDQSNNGQCKTQKNMKHIDSDKQLLSHSVISLIIVITIEKTSSEQNLKQKQMTMASPDAICGVFQFEKWEPKAAYMSQPKFRISQGTV